MCSFLCFVFHLCNNFCLCVYSQRPSLRNWRSGENGQTLLQCSHPWNVSQRWLVLCTKTTSEQYHLDTPPHTHYGVVSSLWTVQQITLITILNAHLLIKSYALLLENPGKTAKGRSIKFDMRSYWLLISKYRYIFKISKAMNAD